jgi:hypothetical protein
MSIQLALRFDEAPVTCKIQQRYHSIAPCLAGKQSAEEQADALGLIVEGQSPIYGPLQHRAPPVWAENSFAFAPTKLRAPLSM